MLLMILVRCLGPGEKDFTFTQRSINDRSTRQQFILSFISCIVLFEDMLTVLPFPFNDRRAGGLSLSLMVPSASEHERIGAIESQAGMSYHDTMCLCLIPVAARKKNSVSLQQLASDYKLEPEI